MNREGALRSLFFLGKDAALDRPAADLRTLHAHDHEVRLGKRAGDVPGGKTFGSEADADIGHGAVADTIHEKAFEIDVRLRPSDCPSRWLIWPPATSLHEMRPVADPDPQWTTGEAGRLSIETTEFLGFRGSMQFNSIGSVTK